MYQPTLSSGGCKEGPLTLFNFLVIVHVFSPNPNFSTKLNIVQGLALLLLSSSELIEENEMEIHSRQIEQNNNPLHVTHIL